jgi:hypothetical protein
LVLEEGLGTGEFGWVAAVENEVEAVGAEFLSEAEAGAVA